ncbi:MAG: S41 family peptidase [Weeksellaceae bacterium]
MQKPQRKNLTDILMYVAIAIFLFGSGYKTAEWNITHNSRERASYTIFNSENNTVTDKNGNNIDFSLFWDTWEKLEQKYIDDKKLDPEKMYYGAIKGMVASVDDQYTFFLTPEENQQSKDDLGGKFQGIGAQLGLKANRIVVIAPLKDSPAEKAGLRAGDFINKVDDKPTKGWTLFEAVSKIRGEEGTSVTLTYERGGAEKDVTITRQEIAVKSVELTYEQSGNKRIAHLVLNQFGDNTNTEWDAAVTNIKTEYDAGRITGMVLDVRDNPGGYLDGAVYTASEFIGRGEKVVTQETTTGDNMTYTAERTGKLTEIPLVVLINEGSASASEILAGALRDHDRAVLIGQKSFGKGSVQEAVDLKNGAGLHVTIAKWILPDGEWINGKGIEPAIKVENVIEEGNTITKETDAQLKKALEEVSK